MIKGYIRFSEIIAWILVVFMLVLLLVGRRMISQERELCNAEKLKAGEMLFECGTNLEKMGDLCSEESKAYIKRGNLLFKCEQDICEKNGWMPPINWEETKLDMKEANNE